MRNLLTNTVMFPDRVDILRGSQGPDDSLGGATRTYTNSDLDVPCLVTVASAKQVAELKEAGKTVNIIVKFPADPQLNEGDILREKGPAGQITGRGFTVQRFRRDGVLNLARWQADCLARNTLPTSRA